MQLTAQTTVAGVVHGIPAESTLLTLTVTVPVGFDASATVMKIGFLQDRVRCLWTTAQGSTYMAALLDREQGFRQVIHQSCCA